MIKARRSIDKILLAVMLITMTGAVTAYNVHSSASGTLSLSLSDLGQYVSSEASAVSTYAEANLLRGDSIFTSAEPVTQTDAHLLEPIVNRP